MPLTDAQVKALAVERATDRYKDASTDDQVLATLNAPDPAISFPRKNVPRTEFLRALLGEVLDIAALKKSDPDKFDKWTFVFEYWIKPQEFIEAGSADVTELLGQMTADEILKDRKGATIEQRVIALTTRPGSRAEELFGEGTVITHDDLNEARQRL